MSKRAEQTLPDDPEALKALLGEQLHQNKQYERQVAKLEKDLQWYKEQFELAKARRFAPSSEQLQDRLFDEAEASEEEAAEPEETETLTYERKKPGRKPLPKDLPREEVHHDLPEDERQCTSCGYELHRIGEERTEELEYIPARMKVLEHVFPKYGCRCCEGGVKSPERPKRPIPGSIATPALLAAVVVGKYADGLPLYRQGQIFKRFGVELSTATLANWTRRSGDLVDPLVGRLHAALLAEEVVHADETRLQVLQEPGREATTKSVMWVYTSGERAPPMVLYDYRQSANADDLKAMLKGFRGHLQTDGAACYRSLCANSKGVTAVGCWAHARRGFHEAAQAVEREAPGKQGKAAHVLKLIRKLYRIETAIKKEGLDVEAAAARRKDKASTVLNQIKRWLDKHANATLPESALGKAIGYALNQWPTLITYLEDGRLSIDNNRAERAVKPFVIGRKNWLFSATPRGAHASAKLYSLAQTAHENKLDPFAYLKYVFERLPYIDSEDTDALDALLPHRIDPDLLSQ